MSGRASSTRLRIRSAALLCVFGLAITSDKVPTFSDIIMRKIELVSFGQLREIERCSHGEGLGLTTHPWYEHLMRSTKMRLAAVLPSGLCLLFAAILPIQAGLKNSLPHLNDLSLSELEQRLAEIDAELETLASFSMRSGVGTLGWRSSEHDDAQHTEWVQVGLEKETVIDEVVLVPTIWRDTKIGFMADGFPLEFRIIAGRGDDTNGATVASFSARDGLLPRVAPLVVSCPATTASWVRVEATRLAPRAWDGKHLLQLSELLVFSGEVNVALRRPVRVSPCIELPERARTRETLVDGFVPYLMDAAEGERSIAFVGPALSVTNPAITIDLEAPYPLSQVHLHTVELSDNVPQAFLSDFGTPSHLVVEGANRSDFSDAVHLLEYRMETLHDTGPIIMYPIPVTTSRYVRLTALDPYISSRGPGAATWPLLGFAETAVLSQGRNVAAGKSTSGNFAAGEHGRRYAALTDGCNIYGRILPIREWMTQLARRHDLETERPSVVAELNRRYARQKANLRRMIWLAELLAAGIVFTLLIDRMLRMRQAARIRERFAADLHDELGANLHAIGLLGDLAKDALDSPEELVETVNEIRAVTERTSAATRFCTDMLTTDGLYGTLSEDMERTARRILADIRYDISIEGETSFSALKPRTRTDLFLFYKECLVNISRHSNASNVSVQLIANSKETSVAITDNGGGVSDVPSSLKRRARLLGAEVSVETPATGGTRITLTLQPRRWRLGAKQKRESRKQK